MRSDQPKSTFPAQPPVPQRRVIVAFTIAIALLAVAGAFFFSRIQSGQLIAVPISLCLLAATTTVLLAQTIADQRAAEISGPRKCAEKIALWSSIVIWVSGIGIAFVLNPTSPFVCVSDGLLLVGFLPLLFLWRFSMPWMIFGIFNMLIGFFLLMLSQMSNELFPQQFWPMKTHLAQYHPSTIWLLLGFVCLAFGIVRFAKNMYLLASRRIKQPTSANQEAK
jgi:hypothetical protein